MAKNPENTVNQSAQPIIPEQLIIGENTFTVKDHPELAEFVRTVSVAAATIEKNKLYPTINQLQESLRGKEGELNLVKTEFQKAAPAAAAAVSFPGTVDGNKFNYQSPETQRTKDALREENSRSGAITPEEVNGLLAKTFNEQMPKLLQLYLEPIINQVQEAKREIVQDYRTRRLTEEGDAVIPEMVYGNTKEEIEASILNSKNVRTRYITQPAQPIPGANTAAAAAGANGSPAPGASENTQKTPPPPPPNLGTPGEKAREQARGMSDDEFRSKRADMLKDLKGQVSQYPQIQTVPE